MSPVIIIYFCFGGPLTCQPAFCLTQD